MCMCVCVCVCYREVAASISSLANWFLYMHIHLQMYKCTYIAMLYTPSPAPTLRVIDLMLSDLSSSAAAPSDRLAAVGLKELRERSP